MFARFTFAATIAIALFSAPAAHAFSRSGPKESVSRDSMAAMLRSMGMKVEDTTEPGGTPWLTVDTKDSGRFNVFLYVCKDDSKPASPCEQIQFRMLWDNEKGRTTDDVNKFHLEKVFGRGYLTEDKKMIGVEYPLHLTGGVTDRNLRENINYFLRVTADFEKIVQP
jgi:hypothetical protein